MLQDAAHLEFETHLVELWHRQVIADFLGQPANIVQRHVSETVYRHHLALVDGVFPVDFEQLLGEGGDDIHFVAEESDDADADNIGDVIQRAVFVALQFQLSSKALLGLDAGIDARHHNLVLVETMLYPFHRDRTELLEKRESLTILVENHLTMHVQFHFH